MSNSSPRKPGLDELLDRLARLDPGQPRIDYLRDVVVTLMEGLSCERLEIGLVRNGRQYRACARVVDGHIEVYGGFEQPEEVFDCLFEARIPLPYGADREYMRIGASRKVVTNKQLSSIAATLSLVLTRQRAEWAMRERVKELECMYSMAELFEKPGLSLDEIVQGIADILPHAWQYPEIARARIILDGRTFTCPRFQEGVHRQLADIVVNGIKRGSIEVHYVEDRVFIDEGPFLSEERALINEVARRVSRILWRFEMAEEHRRLEEQLRHADRLATLGQLAAGVAHELNEPLNSILGFAQLALKTKDLPESATRDMQRIVSATLHAREVVRKLLLFSRQTPPQKTHVALGELIRDALTLVEPRLSRERIELLCDIAPDLPEIQADPSQIQQVAINLIVNAVQAMPNGGRLEVRAWAEDGFVVFTVRDTGVGMSEEVLKHIYTPFFTTKGVGQGTGLGLPVVHGIVTAHGGTIHVTSKVGEGTCFEVRIPVR